MCRQAEALKEQATMIANDLAGSCLGLKDILKDLSSFDERNNLQKLNLYTEKIRYNEAAKKIIDSLEKRGVIINL